MEHVKKHFQEEAEIFDSLIKTIIPQYEDMISALVNSLPFHEKEIIKVLDLGCGTGNVSLLVKKRFPGVRLTCLDLAEKMINETRAKLADYDESTYIVGDLRDLEFEDEFHAVVSSLAIHHLSREEQKSLYKKLHKALKKGGVFYNAEILSSTSQHLNQVYIDMWADFMRITYGQEEIEKLWFSKHQEEDHPQPLLDHEHWLENAGFKNVDVVWKYYYFGVYGGMK